MPAGMATSAKAMASTPRATKQRCSVFLTARNCHNGTITTRTTRLFAYQPSWQALAAVFPQACGKVCDEDVGNGPVVLAGPKSGQAEAVLRNRQRRAQRPICEVTMQARTPDARQQAKSQSPPDWPIDWRLRMLQLLLALTLLLAANVPVFAEPPAAVMYVNPQCSCCLGHANYLRQQGFNITVKETNDMSLIRRQHGVPEKFEGCHIMLIQGYVVEGHVPASAIRRLLAERPRIKGISLPGMPEGSPGMTGVKAEPFKILEISDEARVFAVE